jgi:uncharacterized membrane protein
MLFHQQRKRTQLAISAAYLALALALGAAAPQLGWTALPHAVSELAPESALALLSAIASGMMALTGISFSVVFVFFQLASSAYTPRILAEFGRGSVGAHTVGIFTGTFVYATLAMRAVSLSGRSQLHALVTWIALAWLVASVIALLLLIARVRRLSVGQVLAGLGQHGLSELRARLRPYQPGAPDPAAASAAALDAAPTTQVIAHADVPLYIVRHRRRSTGGDPRRAPHSGAARP